MLISSKNLQRRGSRLLRALRNVLQSSAGAFGQEDWQDNKVRHGLAAVHWDDGAQIAFSLVLLWRTKGVSYVCSVS